MTAASLSEAFSPPDWMDSTVEEVAVAAETGGAYPWMPDFLLSTRRAT